MADRKSSSWTTWRRRARRNRSRRSPLPTSPRGRSRRSSHLESLDGADVRLGDAQDKANVLRIQATVKRQGYLLVVLFDKDASALVVEVAGQVRRLARVALVDRRIEPPDVGHCLALLVGCRHCRIVPGWRSADTTSFPGLSILRQRAGSNRVSQVCYCQTKCFASCFATTFALSFRKSTNWA